MDFHTKLNDLMQLLNITQSDLVNNSKLSSSLISRYCSGTRTPKYGSDQYKDLINALSTLAVKNKVKDYSLDKIKEEIDNTYDLVSIDPNIFVDNFNSLIEHLNIKIYELAHFINYAPSYISKIRNEYILPRNLTNFCPLVSKYIVSYYSDESSKETLSYLFDCNINDLNTDKKYNDKITLYLCNNTILKKDSTYDFLKEVDSFDINQFYDTVNYNKIKTISLPIELHKSKDYYGIDGYKKSQEDMLKTIILSKSKENVFFYSNMSIANASKDNNFKNDFIKGILYVLKKGIHINMVHDLDRPFNELMIGLINWIPLYMTGMIKPYYFKENSNYLYSTMQITSGSACLIGSAITNNPDSAKFTLSTKPIDVKHYKENSNLLLKKAEPLLKVFTIENKNSFINIINKPKKININRRNILYNLPLYTMSEALLKKILKRNKIKEQDQRTILDYYHQEVKRVKSVLENNSILDEISIAKNQPMILNLSGIFFNQEITYTPKELEEHLEDTKTFKSQNKNYNYFIQNEHIFKNINIHIAENKFVIISKAKAPVIQFYIKHPKLINTINKLNINIQK